MGIFLIFSFLGGCPRFGLPPIQHEISKKPVVSYKSTMKTATRPKKSFKNYIYNFKKTVMKSPNLIIGIAIVVMIGISVPIGLLIAKNQNTIPYYDDNNNYNPPAPPDPPPSPQWEIDAQGTVTYIVDGDTFDVNTVGRIRLADIDCPDQGEAGCQEATNYVSSLINGKSVYVDIDDVYGTDPYDRTVAVVYVRHNSTHLLNVNKGLLVQGLATIWNFDNEFNPYEWSLFVYYV